MYDSSGNYELFVCPVKPEGVDQKSAHIIGTGLAALTAACCLVRDGQMRGPRPGLCHAGRPRDGQPL